MKRIGTVAAIWRYPVKSMRGEQLTEASFDPKGMAGDRRFGFVSTAAPPGYPLLASRERTAMLRYTPTLDPTPQVSTPDGRSFPLPSPDLLAELQTTLAAPGAELTLQHSPGLPLTDVRPVSLVSTATLRGLEKELGYAVDPQRFRSNLILTLENDRPFAEDELAGQTLIFDDPTGVHLRLRERIPRCRMVSLDPDTTEADPLLLRHLAKHHDGRLGIYATVLQTGIVHVDNPVSTSI
ncbi:MAG: MOSC domain-containing protein [Janthinobacterium lividum]